MICVAQARREFCATSHVLCSADNGEIISCGGFTVNVSYKPRNYQQACLNCLNQARRQGARKALVVMASGLGKTLTGAFDIREFLGSAPNSRVLVTCHSAAILTQTKAVFQSMFGDEYSYGMYNGLEKAAHRTDFLFANLQSIYLHGDEFDPDEFDYILVDEAHHSPAETYRKAIEHFRPQFLLGMTATPNRMDDAELSDIFGETVFEYPLETAIRDGWLSDVEYRIKTDYIQRLEAFLDSGEKFTMAQLNREVFVPKRDEEIVRIIRDEIARLNDPTMVIFCQTIQHAEQFAALMGDAVVIHSELGDAEVAARIERFRSGAIKTVCAVNMLNEGIDVPRTDVIVFLRVTQSRIVFTQQLGRGLRRAKGKGKVLVLDFVSTADRLDMLFQLEHEFKCSVGRYARRKSDEPREYFTLNIDSPVFTDRKVDIIALIEKAKEKQKRILASDEEMLQMIRDFVRQHGRTPTVEDLRGNPNMPSIAAITRRFGGLLNAIKLAGFKIKPSQEQYTKDELVEWLRRLGAKVGHTPTKEDIDADPDMPGYKRYVHSFGSLTAALILAGFEIRPVCKRYTDKELIELYLICAERVGHTPSDKDLKKFPDMPTPRTYCKRFGSLAKTAELAGLEKPIKANRPSDEEMLSLWREFTEELGRNPTAKEVDENPNLPSAACYRNRFKNFHNIGKLLKSQQPLGRTRYTREEAINLLIQLSKELGHTPTHHEIDASSITPSTQVYRKQFGSVRAAMELAGLKPNPKGTNATRGPNPNVHPKAPE